MSDWQKVRIGEFLFEREGKFKPRDEALIGLSRIEKIDFSGNFHIGNKKSNTNMILIKPGDLVISGINVAKGAMGVYSGSSDTTATIHYSSYTFDENIINVEYFKRFLKSSGFIELLKEQIKGGIKTEIKPKHILPLEIQIPDITGQRKIVSHFKSIESEDDDLKNEINQQQTLLKKLRQAILQEAIEGKLTKQWRKENPDVESASVLLEKIKAEKEKLIVEKKLRNTKVTKNPLTIRDIEIPEFWNWAKGNELFFITKLAGFEYTKLIELKDFGEIPCIRAQNVRPFKINKSKLKYIDRKTSEILYRSSLTKEALLITFIGAGIGDVALFSEEKRWHLAPNVAKQENFESLKNHIHLKYINYFLLSKTGQREIFKHVKATAQPSLSMGTIRDVDYPIPPYFEQKEIVKKVDHLFALCDELEVQINDSKANADILMQAVLKEAFEQ